MTTVTPEQVKRALTEVEDPEIGMDIVGLGLVYKTEVSDDAKVRVEMTLTSPGCPMGSYILTQAHAAVMNLPGVKDVQVDLVWTPPWDPKTMASDEVKAELGLWDDVGNSDPQESWPKP